MNDRIPHTEPDHVLVDVKAEPFGWPTASLDPDSGRGPMARSGTPAQRDPQFQVSTVPGDCRNSMKPAWMAWVRGVGPVGAIEAVWDDAGVPRPAHLDRVFAEEGVDVALLFCEYSPKATGFQRFDDLLPIVRHNPRRFRPVANVNPHLHFPIADEVERQIDLGA